MYIDNPRDKLLVLCGLSLMEFFLTSREFEGYPSEVKYEILAAVVDLQQRMTNVPPPPPTVRYDNYGNPHKS